MMATGTRLLGCRRCRCRRGRWRGETEVSEARSMRRRGERVARTSGSSSLSLPLLDAPCRLLWRCSSSLPPPVERDAALEAESESEFVADDERRRWCAPMHAGGRAGLKRERREVRGNERGEGEEPEAEANGRRGLSRRRTVRGRGSRAVLRGEERERLDQQRERERERPRGGGGILL